MKLPVGIAYKDNLYTEVEIGGPTGKLLKTLRNSLAKNTFDTRIYLDALREGLVHIEGWDGPISEAILRSMYWCDAEYVFMEMAKLDLEDEEPAVIRTCPNCKKQDKAHFAFNEIRVERLDDEDCESKFVGDRTIPFTLKTPITTLDVDRTPYYDGELGLLTVDDWMKMFPKAREKVGSLMMESIASAIIRLGPKAKGEFETAELEVLSARDIKRLERLYNENEPGIKMPDPIPCSNCGTEIPLYIDWVRDFLASNPA